MAPKRFNIESLVSQHGVQGLADKLGVHARSVQRWRNDNVDPSPLAQEKLKQVQVPAPGEKTKQAPMGAVAHAVRTRMQQAKAADNPAAPTRNQVQLPTSEP